MKKIYPILLNAHGLPISFPRDIASAPFMYGGLNITHLYDMQGRENIKFLTLHLKRMDTTGKLMLIHLKYIQLIVGMPEPFQKYNFEKFRLLVPKSWLIHIWEYISQCNTTFDLTESITTPLQREHDRFLIDILHSHFSSSDLCKINKIRLALKLITLADVTASNGKTLLTNIKHGVSHRNSTLNWPLQPIVPKFLPLWQRACRVLQQHLQTNALGYWISTHQEWPWSINNDGTILYNRDQQYIQVTSRRKAHFVPTQPILPKPNQTTPVDVYYDRDRLRVLSVIHIQTYSPKQAPDVFDSCLPNHELPHNLEKKIVKLIKKNRIIYGSDASAKNNRGSFAWGILDKNNSGTALIQFNAHLHGDEEQTHSTRGELFGLLACMRHIQYLKTKYKIRINKKIQIFIYTDSDSSIQIATNTFYLNSKTALDNDSDIKTEVRLIYKNTKKFLSLKFVKSHQDDSKPFQHLSLASKLNVIMDKSAKRALESDSKPSIRHKMIIPHLPAQQISYSNDYFRLTRDILQNLNRYNIGHRAEQYIQRKRALSNTQMQSIAWHDINIVFNRATITKRTQFMKIFHCAWPSMARNKKWNQSPIDICPLCTKCVETMDHVYQCSDSRAKTNRSFQIIELKKKLHGISTAPFIINHVCRVLYQFSSNFPVTQIPYPASVTEELSTKISLMNRQIEMGINNLLSGLLHSDLSTIQELHMKENRLAKRPNISSWNRSIILFFLEYSQSIWSFRSDILHNEALFTQETVLRNQAVALLHSLRHTPFHLPHQSRNLLTRSTEYLQTSHLRNVISWTHRVNSALEDQCFHEKTNSTDIRTWIYSGQILSNIQCTSLRDVDDTWYDPHAYDSDDSEMTANYYRKFPDEKMNTWIRCDDRTTKTITEKNNLIAPK